MDALDKLFADQEDNGSSVPQAAAVSVSGSDDTDKVDVLDDLFSGASVPTPSASNPVVTTVDQTAVDVVPEVSANNDDAMIKEYLAGKDPYYSEEYLRSLDTTKLSEVLYEEDADLVNRHYKLPTEPLTEAEIEEISQGAELVAVDPTLREKSRAAITDALIASGITKNRQTALDMATDFVGNPTADGILESLGAADITPIGAIFALQEAMKEVEALSNADADAASYVLPGITAALSVLEAVPVTKGAVKGVKRMIKGEPSAKTIDEIVAESKKAKDIAEQETRDKYFNARMNISVARGNTAEDIAAKTAAAEKAAAANRDIKNEFIQEFEQRTGKTVSVADASGNLSLDYDLARQAGKDTAEEIVNAQRGSIRQVLTGGADVDMTDAARLIGGQDSLLQPTIVPEKLDGLVAAAADLKKSNPQAFNNKKPIIDNLFDLTVNKELIAGDELLDVLNKYNVSFEDYILTVVGSGSEAGKVLNKLSQIRRARPTNELIAMQEAATKEAQGAIRKTIMRVENIRRGGLVSQLATAARNLTSGGIRAPLEGLGNVMDTALYNYSNKGVVKGTTSLLSPANWSDSFRHMKYMFGPDYAMHTKQYVDFIMEQPELAKQGDLLFNNINEIQRATGRGEGGTTDAVLSVLEDAVDTLNVPNRWQEYLIRRGAFLGELERLTKREWGVDLIDTINQGKIRDLLNDASSVRPKDGRSFTNLVEDATNKALDVTYAKQPDIPVFRSTAQFIVRNGLTTVMPFPRFMFNSMELMGQYAGGMSIPLTRKVANLVSLGKVGKGPLTAKDRQRISRNLVGMAVVGAAYQYRSDDEAPADYKMLKVDDGTEMDTTTQYPMRQFLYLGDATRRLIDGTFSDWFNSKEFAETFVGTNIRQGVGQGLIQEVADLAAGVDLTDEETAAKLIARPLGNYLSTWAVPFAQIIEAQRATGMRGTTYKDVAEDPTLDFQATFMSELGRPFRQRGFTLSAEEEAAAPKREFLFQEEKERVMPMARVLGGLSFSTADSEEGEYIKRLGFTEFELGSRSRVPSIRRFENEVLRDSVPIIVEIARDYEETLRNQYAIANATVRREFTEEQFVTSKLRPIIKQSIGKVKRQITDGKKLMSTAPAYTQAMLEYRRLPKDIRKTATIEFVQKYDRQPDGSDAADLQALAKIGKVYREKLR
jgi:hypothetical protein